MIAQVDQWAELLRTKFSAIARSTVKIVGAPFAGFHYFHNDTEGAADDSLKYIPWDEASFKQYVDYWHASESLPKACVEVNQDAPWKCMVADYSFPHTRTPLFFSQALLDSVVMRLHDNFARFMGGNPHRILFFWHSIGNKFLTALSNAFTNLNLTDMETCYKLFKTEIIQGLNLKEKRFGFEPEVTAKIARVPKVRIYEVGISYYGRTYEEGKKIGWRDGFRAIYCIVKYNIFSKK